MPDDTSSQATPDVWVLSVGNLVHVTLLAPRIWRCRPYFWKICSPAIYSCPQIMSQRILITEMKV